MYIIFNDYFKGTEADISELFELNNRHENIDKIKEDLKNSSHIVTAIDIDAGYKIVGIIRSIDNNDQTASIDHIIIHPKYQNIGIDAMISKRLLEKIKHIENISVTHDNR